MAAKKAINRDISMNEVAELAGVSPMTVSRALRSPQLVSAKTLERIQGVIKSVGYSPNRLAGSLRSNRSTVVALIVPSLRNSLYTEMIQGISDVLQRHQFQLMISDSAYSLEQEEALIDAYISHRVCGIILHNTAHTERATNLLKSARIPVIETGNLTKDPIDMQVSFSNFAAGKAMAEHLVSLGYKRIGFASLPLRTTDRLTERRAGFVAGLRKGGIKLDPRVSVEVEGGLENGARALSHIIDTDPKIEAVFFAGDVLAAGALIECNRRRIAVPKQLAVAASDDYDLIQNLHPALTTVRFPRYKIGVRSAELIIARTRGTETGQSRYDMGFEVIRRGST